MTLIQHIKNARYFVLLLPTMWRLWPHSVHVCENVPITESGRGGPLMDDVRILSNNPWSKRAWAIYGSEIGVVAQKLILNPNWLDNNVLDSSVHAFHAQTLANGKIHIAISCRLPVTTWPPDHDRISIVKIFESIKVDRLSVTKNIRNPHNYHRTNQ